MKRTAAFLLAAIWLASPISPSAVAETASLRCGNRLVSGGDHMYDVSKKCGAPDFVTQRRETRKVKHKVRRWNGLEMETVAEEREVEVIIDEWTYDLGASQFVRYVTFEEGRVVAIRLGDYGTSRR